MRRKRAGNKLDEKAKTRQNQKTRKEPENKTKTRKNQKQEKKQNKIKQT